MKRCRYGLPRILIGRGLRLQSRSRGDGRGPSGESENAATRCWTQHKQLRPGLHAPMQLDWRATRSRARCSGCCKCSRKGFRSSRMLKARYSLQDSTCPNLSSAILHARRVSSANFCFRSLSVLFNQASPFLAFKIDHCFLEGVLWPCPKKYATDSLDLVVSKDVCWVTRGRPVGS